MFRLRYIIIFLCISRRGLALVMVLLKFESLPHVLGTVLGLLSWMLYGFFVIGVGLSSSTVCFGWRVHFFFLGFTCSVLSWLLSSKGSGAVVWNLVQTVVFWD